jgi:hypothetical protein
MSEDLAPARLDLARPYKPLDLGNGEAAASVARTAACWDGSLPGARDPADGTVRSRHWFAWPGAALLVALGGPP